ncbi:DUF4357 domain-containing protein [Hymenobacter nivis]|uniref:DUF4357 domain-containing protein n=1 Tax=Hymenobacter nivis TaxID=1850093 RepID=A0A502HFE7_9BACT|nr:DUF4357 domain-containing protein [Hymenobacter nivis]TPG72313.1 DUF4357 domain-containing protein [Hymenobacter nivis]
MQEILLDIRQRLSRQEYKNEEHVRLSLVARVVQALGWDVWNPTEVYTEFKATKKEDNTRVDVALFTHDFEATAVFIECKAVGAFAADLAAVERQLRDYNRDHTALFTVITDGRHWRFYFSFTSGEFKDKLFCKFDLQEDEPDETAGYLDTFLLRDNILNHSARRKAEAYLMLGKKERAMQDVLPDAQKLVSQPPFPSLPVAMVQLLAAKVLTITPAEAQAFLMGTALAAAGAPAPVVAVAAPATGRPAERPLRKQPVAKAAPLPAGPAPAEQAPGGERFVLKQGPAHATAHLQPGGALLVLAGSVAAAAEAASLSAGGVALRKKLLASGVLKPHGEQLVFAIDHLFDSANSAATVLVARSVNAQTAWQHPSGKQVRDFLE